MKKIITTLTIFTFSCLSVHAGGLFTNTSYHAAYERMLARGATTEIDAVFSNPAGIVWGDDGWKASFNWLFTHQDRDIISTFPLYTDENHTHKYKSDASAPFVPSLFASYKHNRWSASAAIGIIASGGFMKYADCLPMIIAPLQAGIYQQTSLKYGVGLTPDNYTTDASIKAMQYVWGAQISGAYRINDWLSASLGLRFNLYDGYYRGHAVMSSPSFGELVNLQLDCDQSGVGYTPIIGLNYHKGRLNVGAKYEFRTKIRTKNKTNQLSAFVGGNDISNSEIVEPYKDGAYTRNDLAGFFSIAAQYNFTNRLRAALEYHFFDEKNAKTAGEKQKELKHGTHEYIAGAEYDINKTFTVSAGAQRSEFGHTDEWQSNTAFSIDCWTFGTGGKVNVTDKLAFNIGLLYTLYDDDYTVKSDNYQNTGLEGSDKYHRTNYALSIGVDYKF